MGFINLVASGRGKALGRPRLPIITLPGASAQPRGARRDGAYSDHRPPPRASSASPAVTGEILVHQASESGDGCGMGRRGDWL